MPICDSCGRRLDESRGRFFQRESGKVGGSMNASYGWGGVSKKSRKRVGYSGGRKVYKQVFVCFHCRPMPSAAEQAENSRFARLVYSLMFTFIFGGIGALSGEQGFFLAAGFSAFIFLLNIKWEEAKSEPVPTFPAPVVQKNPEVTEERIKQIWDEEEIRAKLDPTPREFDMYEQCRVLNDYNEYKPGLDEIKQEIFDTSDSDYQIAKKWKAYLEKA